MEKQENTNDELTKLLPDPEEFLKDLPLPDMGEFLKDFPDVDLTVDLPGEKEFLEFINEDTFPISTVSTAPKKTTKTTP